MHEFRILEGSNLANRTRRELESEYGVTIAQTHDYPSQFKPEMGKLGLDGVVYPLMYLKISGTYDNVKRITLDSISPKINEEIKKDLGKRILVVSIIFVIIGSFGAFFSYLSLNPVKTYFFSFAGLLGLLYVVVFVRVRLIESRFF